MSVTLVGVTATCSVASVGQIPPVGVEYFVPGRGYLNDTTNSVFALANWGFDDGVVSVINPQTTVTLSGVAATGQAGTAVASVSESIVGVAATGAVGTVQIESDATLLGVAATGQVGTLSPQHDGSASVTGVAGIGQVGTLTTLAIANPTTGSGDDARRRYLDWKKQQKQQKRDKAKPVPTPTPRTPQIESKPPKPLAVPSELAAQLLAQNLANQRAQLERDIGSIFSQEVWANDEDEAITLLLLEAVI